MKDNKVNIKRLFLNLGLLGIELSLLNILFLLPDMDNYVGNPIWGTLIVIVPCLAVVIICAGAFKGYKRDFIERYKKPVTATVIIQLCMLVFSAVDIVIMETKDRSGSMMPGLDALGEFLFMILLWIAAALVIAVIWIVACVKYFSNTNRD